MLSTHTHTHTQTPAPPQNIKSVNIEPGKQKDFKKYPPQCESMGDKTIRLIQNLSPEVQIPGLELHRRRLHSHPTIFKEI